MLGSIAFILYCITFSPFKLHGYFLLIGAICFIGVDLTFSVPAISLVLTAIGGLFLQMGLITYGASVVPLSGSFPGHRAGPAGIHLSHRRGPRPDRRRTAAHRHDPHHHVRVRVRAHPHRRGRRLRPPASGPAKAS